MGVAFSSWEKKKAAAKRLAPEKGQGRNSDPSDFSPILFS